MLKTSRQFYILSAIFGFSLVVVLLVVLLTGDASGQPLRAKLEYLLEGNSGLPQIALTFDKASLPERTTAEAAFEIAPALPGDISWNDTTLLFTPSTPLLSDTEYQVRLRGGLKLLSGKRLEYNAANWLFRTRPARITYLKQEGKAVNLWLDKRDGTAPQPLTFETDRRILDFTVSPGGERLVYSLEEPDLLTAGLWLIKLDQPGGEKPLQLVLERKIKATAPRWSPSGDLIAYERRITFDKGGFSPAQLWLVKADGTSLPPLYGGTKRVGVNLSWTRGGDQVFFWEPLREAVGIFNFAGEPTWKTLPGPKPSSLAVSPDGREIILAVFDFSGAQEKQVLLHLSLKKGDDKSKMASSWEQSSLQLTTPAGFNDLSPSWSPDGRFISFVREEATPGKNRNSRIWLFDTQNGKTQPLIEDNQFGINQNQGTYQWSDDSQQLLFELYSNNSQVKPATEIWEVGTAGKNPQLLTKGGSGPMWVR